MRFPELSEIASHFNVTKIGLQELLKARDSLKEVQFPLCQVGMTLSLWWVE